MSQSQPFGKYNLLERLASGSVAEIFRATTHTGEGRELQLVIKRIRPELAADGRFAVQFAEEARQMALMQHENIAKVYEWGRHEDALFVAMELIEGTNLHSLMMVHRQQGRRFPPIMALYVAAEVLSGLEYAHNMKDAFGNPQFVVHRDVCPANILISSRGEVKLVDFGLAKAAVEVQANRPDVLGERYRSMAPEVLRGEKVTPQADLYSVGVLLYELITGASIEAPQSIQAAESVARAIGQRPASQVQPDVPAELDALILRAIAPEPTARPASAMDLRTELVTFLNRWDRSVNAAALATFIQETLAGRAAKGEGKPGFAFGEATSHWFVRGDEIEKIELVEDGGSETSEQPRKARAGFAAGSTVMAVEESGLGKGRHLKAWALVGGLLVVVALVVLLVANLGDRPVVTRSSADEAPESASSASSAYAGPVQVQCKPEQVIIFVDGDMVEPQGQPPRLMGLRAGTRRFKVLAPGYLPWEGDVDLRADEPTLLERELQERQGKLTIRSTPPKALVFVDGKRVGKTPHTMEALSAAAAHKIVLRARRHEPLEFEVAPADWPEDADAELVLEKTLEKLTKKSKRRRPRRRSR